MENVLAVLPSMNIPVVMCESAQYIYSQLLAFLRVPCFHNNRAIDATPIFKIFGDSINAIMVCNFAIISA